jgi:hypothetical protein
MDKLSAVEPNDDEAIEQVECERRDDEQVVCTENVIRSESRKLIG